MFWKWLSQKLLEIYYAKYDYFSYVNFTTIKLKKKHCRSYTTFKLLNLIKAIEQTGHFFICQIFNQRIWALVSDVS